MRDQRVVIVGGSSGIGFKVAELATARGARVHLGGRDLASLARAAQRLGPTATTGWIDVTQAPSVDDFFAATGPIDHLFTPGASYSYGRFAEIDEDTARSPFESKFWGQYRCVRAALPLLAEQASIVLMSGAAGARPLGSASAYAACNSAIDGLGRALALELAPRRVNVVAPGTIDSELWQRRPAALREQAYGHYAGAVALGRVGTVDEVADAVLFLMGNSYTTGSVLYPDGGYTLR